MKVFQFFCFSQKQKTNISSSSEVQCFQGPIGSGKTTLVKEVAEQLGLPYRSIQIGDQIDSKSLFGSFQCCDVPGEFIWKPSAFAGVNQIFMEFLKAFSCNFNFFFFDKFRIAFFSVKYI